LFGFIDLNSSTNMYYFVLAVFIIGMLIIWRFINSPFGMILKSIRENEQRAISLGYSVARCKLEDDRFHRARKPGKGCRHDEGAKLVTRHG
ncbi:hypothetical protein ACC699_38335, partial [Rhizobium ruizarguesonis]